MRRAYSVAAVRAMEEPFLRGGSLALMLRAAAGLSGYAADILRAERGGVYGARVLALVGRGANGGDALFAARNLSRRGAQVTVVESHPGEAHAAGRSAALGAGVEFSGLEAAAGRRDGARVDLVIDVLVGIGGAGPLRAAEAGVVAAVRGAWTRARTRTGGPVPVLAVDLPSGVDADSGVVHDPVLPVTHTAAMGVLKPLHLRAAQACGDIRLIPLGLDESGQSATLTLVEAADIAPCWPVPGPHDHKYSTGTVAIRAGSERYPGAARLAVGGAVSATSGMVRYRGPCADAVLRDFPEIVLADAELDLATVAADAWLIGPGMGTDSAALRELRAALAFPGPVVIDADALTLLAENPRLLTSEVHEAEAVIGSSAPRLAPRILTPHAGELQRVYDGVFGRGESGESGQSGRSGAAAAKAERLVRHLSTASRPVIIVVKGHTSAVLGSGQAPRLIQAASSWAATPGTGDVLGGIVAAVVAGIAKRDAAADGAQYGAAVAAATWVHAQAAEVGAEAREPIRATDLVAAVPLVLARLASR